MLKEYKPILEQGLRRSFPEMKELSFRCVSGKDIGELREKMLRKGLTK